MLFFNRKSSYAIMTVFLALALAMLFYGFRMVDDLHQLRESEVALFQQSSDLDQTFAEFQRALGFGGFVHNVKEYLLNQDSYQLLIIEANIKEIESSYSLLRTQFETHKSTRAVETLDEFVAMLRQAYQKLRATENQPFDAAELNRSLDIDSPRVLSAIVTLETLKDNYGKRSIIQIRSSIDALVSSLILAAVLLPITLAVGFFVVWLLNQAILAKQELETAKQTLEKSEDSYRKLFNSSRDGYVINKGSGEIINANPAFAKMLGYTLDEIQQVSWRDMTPKHWLEWELKNHGRQLLNQGFTSLYEKEYLRKDGSTFPVEIQGFLLNMPEKIEDALIAAFARDITERKQIEAQRKELEEQLRQKYKMEAVGVLAGGIAHNFNNNLAIILGNIELAQMRSSDPNAVRKYLDLSKTAMMRSRDLIKQIMIYSRQEDYEKKAIPLALIVDETLNLLYPTIPTTVALQPHIFSSDAETVINANATQIQQALINLCTNAVHAMDEKGNLDIFLDALELQQKDIPETYQGSPGRYVRLSVKDTGSGIPKENLEKIFDPFFTTKEVDQGTGMGLSTVRGIIEQHGGFIKVHSAMEEGTTIDLYFPPAKEEQVEAIAAEKKLLTGSEKILFVDDDEMLAELGKDMLTAMGYQATSQTNALEALETVKKDPTCFDLVITDQTMPGLTGKEFAQQAKKIRPDLPIILCTGYSAQISAKDSKQYGIDAFCLKPLEMTELSQLIRGCLDEPHK